jgi:hypothetical protein
MILPPSGAARNPFLSGLGRGPQLFSLRAAGAARSSFLSGRRARRGRVIARAGARPNAQKKC